jgi:NADPH:quinone reductase-like Zn-dependent oxidoreductase
MKAIVCTKYGPPDVLQLREVEKPTAKKNEVLIKISATAVTASDCLVRKLNPSPWKPRRLMIGLMLGFKKPRSSILGLVLAGTVEDVGKKVTRFKAGDEVFAFTVKWPTQMRGGAYAEYMCLPEDGLMALKPSNLTYEEAAAIPFGGLIALHFLKKRKYPDWTKCAYLRGFRRDWHFCCTACQPFWSNRYRGMQHGEFSIGEILESRYGH